MAEQHLARLEREARVLTAALIGAQPADYVVRQYVRGHVSLPLAPVQGFDAVLMRVARRGALPARVADAYARLLAPRAIMRRKMVLLLAILESAAPTDAAFTAIASGAPVTVLRLAIAGAGSVLVTLLGLVLIGPLHVLSRIAAGRA